MRPAKEFPTAREHFSETRTKSTLENFPRLIFAMRHQKRSPRLNHARVTQAAMAEVFLKWGWAKNNDQISFAYNPYLACTHVTCPTYEGFRPTVLVSTVVSASKINCDAETRSKNRGFKAYIGHMDGQIIV